MCGINGFNFRNEDLIKKMNSVTRHRGPDATGVYLGEQVSLGHNRLSIIDLDESANQPMRSNDGNLIIVFNGEIYNFKELKEELKDFYNFKTSSDTEVILASYQKWGYDCVKKFNGIFAFAIWDKSKKEIYLARDHVGVKPLYYFHKDSQFVFSSELKGILEHGVPRLLDMTAFNHWLRVQYVPEPYTMIKNIFKLPPASFTVFRNDNFEIKKYWQAGSGSYFNENKRELAERLRSEVAGAVKRQLISDRPLGVYLSGGFDSSIVLDCAVEVRGNDIHTFSTGFELSFNEENEKFNADFELAKKTAKFYGTNHHEVLLKESDVVDNFEKVVWHSDEPVPNPTTISMFTLANFTKQNADVVLGGDGGDELFGGYDRYRMSLAATYYQKLTHRKLRKLLSFEDRLKKLAVEKPIDRFALFLFQKDAILQKVINSQLLNLDLSKDFFEKKFFLQSGGLTAEELLMQTDRESWLVDHSLFLADRMAMSAGLENRVPLLDKELIEFASKIPLQHKLGLFKNKKILREAFKDRLPSHLFNQPKRGWFSPGAKWLRRPQIKDFAKEVLSASYHEPTTDLLKFNELNAVFENHCNKREYNLGILWALITFQIWAKLYDVKLN